MKTFINPGHHIGVDSGAVNEKYHVCEAQIVKDIAVLLRFYLEAAYVQVEMLQSDNLLGENPKYYPVVQTANGSGADLFVSLHCNSAENRLAHGTETLIYGSGGKAEKAASCIQRQLVDSLGTLDRGIKERPGLAVLRGTTMPAVLVEIAFISNEDDVNLLMHQKAAIARVIARGITDWERGETVAA
mgnify:FL=1